MTFKGELHLDTPVKSVLLNMLCMDFIMLVCEVQFGSETDLFVRNIVAGVYGKNYAYAANRNLIFTKIISLLYELTARIPWFAVIQILMVFLSLTIIVYFVLDANKGWGGYLLTFILLSYLGFECYARISMVKTSAICTAAGCMIFYRLLEENNKKFQWLIIGIFLLATGAAMSFAAYLICAILFLWEIVSAFISKRSKQPEAKNTKTILIIFSVLFLLTFFGQGIIVWHNQGQRMEQISFYETYDAIQAIGWPTYGDVANHAAFELSEDVYGKLVQGYVYDKGSVHLNDLKIILAEARAERGNLLDFTRQYMMLFFKQNLFLCFLILLFLSVLSQKKGKYKNAAYIISIMILIDFVTFLWNAGTGQTMYAPILISSSMALLLSVRDTSVKTKDLELYYTFLAVIMLTISIRDQYGYITKKHDMKWIENTQIASKTIVSDSGHIYFSQEANDLEAYLPLMNVPVGLYRNRIILNLKYYDMNYVSQTDISSCVNNNKIFFLSEEFAWDAANTISKKEGKSISVEAVSLENSISAYRLCTE